jgi:hypothetical protein
MKLFLLFNILNISNCFTNNNLIGLQKYNVGKFRGVLKMAKNVNKDDFNNIDLDNSGYLDSDEMVKFYGKINYMDMADLNDDKKLDYLEFDRLANIQKFGEKNGGNLFVRNAINFGLVKSDSILADGEASIMIGNKGFDPLNCATNIITLRRYREAELKHGRLAMLASVGWPLSEKYHPYLSNLINKENLLAVGGKAPSLLNGGLEKINPAFFMMIIILSTTIESLAISKKYDKDIIPGDLAFDPLKLYSTKDVKTKRELELKELNNGRLAMIAITYYVISEFITKMPIIK